jgi:hypothetical protein
MKIFGSFLLVLSVSSVCLAMAVPRPAVVQDTQQWTLDVKHSHLQQVMLRDEQDGKTKRFWYLVLTVTNNTGDDVDFYPQCEMATDTFEITKAGTMVPPAVFEQIKKRHQAMYPFLEALDSSGMRILQGEDNTRDIAIIWPDFDTEAKQANLFITGLSNETAVVEYPAEEEGGEPTRVFLRKTLELDYTFSGDPKFRAKAKMEFTGENWIMR